MSTTQTEPGTEPGTEPADTPAVDELDPDAPPDDDEPEDEPGQQTEPGEPSRTVLRSFEAELERHEREVREIMGPWMPGYVPCSECHGVGLIPPSPEVKDSPMFKVCDDCNGYGQVKTGALNPEHATRPCPGCKGRGYLEKLSADGTPLAGIPGMPDATPPAPPAVEGDQPAEQGGETFGTPAWLGDPSIGR